MTRPKSMDELFWGKDLEDVFDRVERLQMVTKVHEYDEHCRNPILAKCGGEAQHFQSWGFGVLRDSRMFIARQRGPKHLALRCSWCH
jgi:hypothetical protein